MTAKPLNSDNAWFNDKNTALTEIKFLIKKQLCIFKLKKMMETKIIEKPAMQVIGFTLKTSFTDERNKVEIPPFFHKILEDGKLESIPDRLNNNQLCVFQMKKGNPDFNYTMGVEVSVENNVPDNMTSLLLPSSRYVTIKIVKRGPEDVGHAFGYIYKKWIPNTVYIPTGEPSFIYYDDEFFRVYDEHGYAGNPLATVFVPIKTLFIKRLLSFLRIKRFSKL
jgi:predicted transcriptional regulator YdeE